MTFEGFEPSNTTPVPDVLFDMLLPHLSGAELKVLLYIIRRTWGFKKDSDAISFRQFLKGIVTKEGKRLDYGCGISNRTVLSKALTDLESKGYIKSTKGKDPSGDNAISLYSIHFKSNDVVSKTYHPAQRGSIETVPQGSNQSVPPVVSKPYHRSIETVPGVVSKPYPQETVIQSNSLQETDKQESVSASVEQAAVSGTDVPTRALSSQSDLSTKATSEQDNVARENDYHSQLSTSQASYPRESAKVEPRPSTYQPPARVRNKSSKNKADYRISWSVEGAAFRGWYEELTGVVLDETAANARACNALAKRSSVTYDNLKIVVNEIRTNKWVQRERVAVTVQDLASDDKTLRWEKWLLAAQQAKPPQQAKQHKEPTALELLKAQQQRYAQIGVTR